MLSRRLSWVSLSGTEMRIMWIQSRVFRINNKMLASCLLRCRSWVCRGRCSRWTPRCCCCTASWRGAARSRGSGRSGCRWTRSPPRCSRGRGTPAPGQRQTWEQPPTLHVHTLKPSSCKFMILQVASSVKHCLQVCLWSRLRFHLNFYHSARSSTGCYLKFPSPVKS